MPLCMGSTGSVPFGPTLNYILVPAWFSETLIIDHQNVVSWREQKEKLLAVDSLQLGVSALQDSILRLETGKSASLEAGYGNAFNGYRGLSDRYITELSKHRHDTLNVRRSLPLR